MRYRTLTLCVSGILALSIAGCGGSGDANSSEKVSSAQEKTEAVEKAATQTVSYDGMSVEASSSWTVSDNENGGKNVATENTAPFSS